MTDRELLELALLVVMVAMELHQALAVHLSLTPVVAVVAHILLERLAMAALVAAAMLPEALRPIMEWQTPEAVVVLMVGQQALYPAAQAALALSSLKSINNYGN